MITKSQHCYSCMILLVFSLVVSISGAWAQTDWVKSHLLCEDEFETPALDQWICEVEKPDRSEVKARGGKLEIDVGGGATIWFKHLLTGDVLIEYDVVVIQEGGVNDRVSDLNQFWMATDPANSNLFTRSGSFSQYDGLRLYYVGMGGNKNSTTRFRRYPGGGARPLLGEHRNPEYLLKPNTKYHIEIVCFKGETQFKVNGKTFHQFKDPEPLVEGYFGFRTVRNHETIDDFKVYRLVQAAP